MSSTGQPPETTGTECTHAPPQESTQMGWTPSWLSFSHSTNTRRPSSTVGSSRGQRECDKTPPSVPQRGDRVTGTRATSGRGVCLDVAFSARAGRGGDPGRSQRLLQTVGQLGTGDGRGRRLLRLRHPRRRLEISSRPRHHRAGSRGAPPAAFSRGQGSPLPTPESRLAPGTSCLEEEETQLLAVRPGCPQPALGPGWRTADAGEGPGGLREPA